MVVGVHTVVHRRERLAGVGADGEAYLEQIHPLLIDRVLLGTREVERAGITVVGACPALSAVCAAINTAGTATDSTLLGGSGFAGEQAVLDGGDNDIWVRSEIADADSAQTDLGNALGDLAPRGSAIGGLVHATAVTAADKVEWGSAAAPSGREEIVRVLRVALYVDDSGVLIDIQNVLPGLAAIDAAVHAALGVWPPKSAEGAYEDDVWVSGIDVDFADVARLSEPHVLPGLAAVGGVIDAIAPGDRVPAALLTGAEPDVFRVVLIDGNGSQGDGGFPIENGCEAEAAVIRTEQATGGRSDEVDARSLLVDGDVHDSAAHVDGADRSGR